MAKKRLFEDLSKIDEVQRCRKQKLSGGAKVNIINIYIILLCITQKIWGGHGPLAPPFLRL